MNSSKNASSKKYIDISPFDLSRIPFPAFNGIFGRRGTGKTSLAQHLAQHSVCARTGNFIVIVGAEKVRQKWAKIVHPACIRDPSLEYLDELIKTGNDIVKKFGDNIPDYYKFDIYIDDCGTLDWFMNSSQLKWLAAIGRQIPAYRITILLQYMYMTHTKIRENFDQLFVLATNNSHCIKTYQAEYVNFMPMREFTAILTQVTRHRGVLVIDNTLVDMDGSQTCSCFRVSKQSLENMQPVGHPKIRQNLDARLLTNLEAQNDNKWEAEDDEAEEEQDLLLLPTSEETCYSDRFGRIIVREKKPKFD